MKLIPLIAQPLIQVSLFLLIFDMQLLKDSITSKSEKEFLLKEKLNKTVKIILITVYTVFILGIQITLFALNIFDKVNDAGIDYPVPVNVLLGLRMFSKILFETYLITKFLRNFSFLVKEKQKALKIKHNHSGRGEFLTT